MKIRIAKKIDRTYWPVRLMVYNRGQIEKAAQAVMRWQRHGPAWLKRMRQAQDRVYAALRKAESIP